MSDRAALLAAVCANPDDDTTRLVFADWLEENGEGKRAAYIRAAVELHRRENADTPAAAFYQFLNESSLVTLESADCVALDAELSSLFAMIEAQKAARMSLLAKAEGLPRIRGVRFCSNDRGFYNTIFLKNTAMFLANAAEIFRAAPISGVIFSQMTPEDARDFIASGYLSRLRRLELDAAEPLAVRIIGDHPDAAGITHLRLVPSLKAHEQGEQLGAGKHWTGVTHLGLGNLELGNEDPDECVIQLLRRPQFRRLQHLILHGNELNDESAEFIASAGLKELRSLNLRINNIRNAGAEALARSKLLPSLRYLDISMNYFGPTGMSELIVSPRLAKLTALRLDGCDTAGLHAKTLQGPCRGPSLRALHIESVSLTASGLAALANCRAVHGLWYLALDWARVTDAGLQALTRSPGFRQLTVLDLASNDLTTRGLEMLAKWPVPLRWLDLLDTTIDATGAKALIASEHLQGVRRLLAAGGGATKLRKHFGKQVVP